MAEETEFYADYESSISEAPVPDRKGSMMDSEREYPIEPRCCVTGEEVKHSYCRYPDIILGSMMVMSREVMLRYTRVGGGLGERFERVLELRRKKEKRKR